MVTGPLAAEIRNQSLSSDGRMMPAVGALGPSGVAVLLLSLWSGCSSGTWAAMTVKSSCSWLAPAYSPLLKCVMGFR
jgi:hypothetical protein